jgi:hypothetical protein
MQIIMITILVTCAGTALVVAGIWLIDRAAAGRTRR